MEVPAETTAATGRRTDAKALADELDALKAHALAGDAEAREQYQAAYQRAHNPMGPEDEPWQVAWTVHMERDRPRREHEGRRLSQRLRFEHALHTVGRVRTQHLRVRPRNRGAGAPAGRTASRGGDSGDDDGSGSTGTGGDDPPDSRARLGDVPADLMDV